MEIVYGVQWIEVEFGERPEGWKFHLDRERAIADARRASREGAYDGGYCGPERPLTVYEIPIECLEPEWIEKLRKDGFAWSTNRWDPKFKNGGTRI